MVFHLRKVRRKYMQLFESILRKYFFLFIFLNILFSSILSAVTKKDKKFKYKISAFIFQSMYSYYYLMSSLLEGKWGHFKNVNYRIGVYTAVILGEGNNKMWKDVIILCLIMASCVIYKYFLENDITEFCLIKVTELQKQLKCNLGILR